MLFTGPNKAVAYQNWQLGAMKMLQLGLLEFSDLNIFEWPHLKSTLQSHIFSEQNLWTQVCAISFSNKGCFVPSQRIPKGLKSLKIWKATWENRAECREVESWLLCDIELKWNSFKADLTFPFDNALSQIWYIYRCTLHHVSYLVHLSFLPHWKQVAQRRIMKRQRAANWEWQTLWKAFRPFIVMPHRACIVFTFSGVTQSKETWMCCVNL